jgi:hypothetical protein
MQKTSGNSLRTFRPSHSSGARFLPLLALVLLVLGLRPAPVLAQAPNVAYSGPITINSGGTYSGNFRSTDSNTPVIRINTPDPVIIENSILVGAGDIIWANNGGANLTIRNNQAYGLTPTVDNRGRGRFLAASGARNLNVTGNYLEHTTGFTIYQWSGDGSPSQTVTILRNKVKNIDGRQRNGGFTMSNFVGLNTVRNVGNIEIAWNQVINEPDLSSVEDNINFYNSGGTSSSPARVHDNYVQGAYPLPATDGTFSGTGFTTDGDGSSASTTAAFIQAYNNQFISTCNAAMNIAAGHDIRFYNNRMVTSGMLPDGRRLNGTYAATAIFNAYQQPASVMYNNSVDNNTIGFVKWGYSSPYQDRHDLSSGACANCPSNTHLPNPITVQTEQNEYVLWTQKLSQNGITLGVGGSGGSTPTSPTPAPAPAPAPTAPTTGSGNTGSTPMAGPAGYSFFRGLNVNGAAVTLDGHAWEAAAGAANVTVNGTALTAPTVGITPNTEAARADMIRSFVYSRNVTASIGGVANGTYAVYLYLWEDNAAETYDIQVQGQTVRAGFNSGAAGSWQRVGPFTANVTGGSISLATSGGDANLSGIEIWKQNAAANQAPTVTLTAGVGSLTVNTALTLTATAADADGSVSKVEFFSGATKIGEDTSAPYTLSYSPTATGTLTLTARATDNAGATTNSAAVSVTVAAAPSPGGSTPMTGPSGATFYRGINVGGAAVTLDGNAWEAGTAANVSLTGMVFSNPSTALNPATDAARASMIADAVGGNTVGATLSSVPNGTYSVYAYIWEDNAPETTNLVLNGTTVRSGLNTGAAGTWQRVGPFQVNVTGGSIAFSTSGGHPNLSGLEVWKRTTTTTPTPTRTLFRAVNLNGAATTIDGISYETGTTARNITTNGGKLVASAVNPNPATDANRTSMLRSFVWGRNLNLTVSSVPNGTYEVAYYVFEDNAAETVSATVNGQAVLTNYSTGSAGTWRKTTPVTVTVTNGQITLQSSGGYLNVSGLEIFRIQ